MGAVDLRWTQAADGRRLSGGARRPHGLQPLQRSLDDACRAAARLPTDIHDRPGWQRRRPRLGRGLHARHRAALAGMGRHHPADRASQPPHPDPRLSRPRQGSPAGDATRRNAPPASHGISPDPPGRCRHPRHLQSTSRRRSATSTEYAAALVANKAVASNLSALTRTSDRQAQRPGWTTTANLSTAFRIYVPDFDTISRFASPSPDDLERVSYEGKCGIVVSHAEQAGPIKTKHNPLLSTMLEP